MTKKPIIVCENVSKRFGKQTAVDHVSLDVAEGEFFALLGPSGCGKTTLLRMIAGLEVPSEGRILIDGIDMAKVSPHERPVNMVFQSYAVFPHMSVEENVGYGLKVDGVKSSERKRRVAEALADVQLSGFETRMPDQLSGGQRQRVALARALVKRPRVLLLDEPLSALDAKLREQMRFELADLQEKVGITFVFVTHDQDEALAMASRCAVMNKGVLQQVATPTDLYELPNSRFVADFIGSVNLFEGRLTGSGTSGAEVAAAELKHPIQCERSVAAAKGATVWTAIRPEKMTITLRKAGESPPQPGNVAAGIVKGVVYLGSESIYEIELESKRRIKVLKHLSGRRDEKLPTWEDPVWITWPASVPVLLLS